ncbi:MAG: hypothetical protein R2705_25460 [Ilumatobacteraceae bacterium]
MEIDRYPELAGECECQVDRGGPVGLEVRTPADQGTALGARASAATLSSEPGPTIGVCTSPTNLASTRSDQFDIASLVASRCHVPAPPPALTWVRIAVTPFSTSLRHGLVDGVTCCRRR